MSIGPVEILLHGVVLLLILVPAAKRSVHDDFTPSEAIQWLLAAAGGMAIVRMSPTERLNAASQISGNKKL